MRKWLVWCLLISSTLGAKAGNSIWSDEDTMHQTSQEKMDHELFDPGVFIMEHVMDSYEWHILTIGETNISIPLPVILYTKNKGLVIFWSSKFHQGHKAYKGFAVAQEGPDKGKIVVVNADGVTDTTKPLPVDLSITKTVFAMMVSLIILLIIFVSIGRQYRKAPKMAPKGLQSLMEPVILFIRDEVAIPSIGKERYERFMPFLLTIFFFILFNNLLGIIPIPPGGVNVTGNITITGVLALFTFLITTFSADKYYWKNIYNEPGVPWWLKFPVPLMPFIELLGIFTKPLVLCIRLFANMLAGHFIALSFIVLIFIFGQISWIAGYGVSVISVLFYIFMTILEVLVAFIQAYVFTLLSALYFGMAKGAEH